MSISETTRRSPPIGAIIVLAVAVFLYAGMMANLDETHNPNSDAMGRGLAAGFAVVFLIAEWLVLAVLLMIGGVKGEMPAWSAMTGTILLPLSGFSAGSALGLLDNGTDARYILVPALIPPVIAGYAMWARLTILHRTLRPLPTSLVAWLAVAILATAPLPRYSAQQAARPAPASPQKSALQQLDDEEKQIRLEMADRFHKLTPGSPLWEWDNFFDDPDFGKQAIAAARQLTHRQADAEQELDMGIGTPLIRYQAIDLAPTPAFCAAAGRFLSHNAKENRSMTEQTDFLSARDRFTRYEDGMRWLMESRCNLDAGIAAIREVVAGYRQTDGRDAYLAHLAQLK